MSIGVSDLKKELLQAIQRLADVEVVCRMKDAQHEMVDALATEKIAEFVEVCVSEQIKCNICKTNIVDNDMCEGQSYEVE